jgi:uncharacterized repeat protein (TIGR01451 family)
VAIDLDTGFGLANIFTSSAGNPISNSNSDTGSSQEQAQWTAPVFSAPNYTLQLGYADNAHGCTAPATGATTCFPNPFNGSGGTIPATVFIGSGVTFPAVPSCGNNCYDGGALLITGIKQNLNAACIEQTVGQVNVPYSSFIEASGGKPPYGFALNSGSLPPILTLNPATGEISGVPTTAGTYKFTVKLADSSSTVQTAITDNCSVTVVPPGLFILKDGPSEVPVSGVFDFTILVENNGGTTQHGVTVVDRFPADGNFISSQPSGFPSASGITIPLGDLAPGASTTVIVTWRASRQEGTLVNSTSVFSSSSSAGPSMAEVQVRENVVKDKLDDVNVVAAGTALRNRHDKLNNGGMKPDGTIKIPAQASFVEVKKAFLVWTVLFQGTPAGVVNKGIVDKISNKITFDGEEFKGINATKPMNPKDKPQQWKLWSGPLCWPNLSNKNPLVDKKDWDHATIGFVADVTAKVKAKMKANQDTTFNITDPVNAANRVNNPDGNNPIPVYPVTDGASLFVFYTIEGQPKTQVLYDFQYDSNALPLGVGGKTVQRKFDNVKVNNAVPTIILAGADGQNDAPDITKFLANSGTGDVRSSQKWNLWNGIDPLLYGAFKVGNLWDTLSPMEVPKDDLYKKADLLLKDPKRSQTFEVLLAPSDDARFPNKVGDCVGISGAVLVTPQ